MKYIQVVVSLTLCLALLTGCALTAAEPPAVMGGDATQEPAPTAAPTATPVPPSTVPDSPPPETTAEPAAPESAPGEKNGMYDLLAEVFDNYHFGVAGSSLKGAYCAAAMVDYGVKNGTDAVRAGAEAWDRGMETPFGETMEEKLSSLYSIALSLYGRGKAVLNDCGWQGAWDYSASDVREVFTALYSPLGLEAPAMYRAYFPDGEASSLLAAGVELSPDIASESVAALSALLADRVLSDGAILLSAWREGDTVHLDMNEAFAQRLRSLGSAGERLTLAAVVNTALDYFDGAGSVVLTAEGAAPETGHDIYDYPIGYYEEQP